MATTAHVALLRGINVGGRNPVRMAELRAMFEAEGFGSVRTHIQSGNVLFDSDVPRVELEDRIEAMLERHLGLHLVVVVRSHRQLRTIVQRAPLEGFADPTRFHSDVSVLRCRRSASRG